MATMKVRFSVNQLNMIRYRSGAGIGRQIVFNLRGEDALPSETHVIASLGELNAKFADYVERAKATGKSLAVSIMKVDDGSRKLRGFDAREKELECDVNPAFEDGTPYVVETAA